MNTANEQTKNSNNNFQNSNLTNSGSKKFTRDYDKEPLVIKSYERFFVANLLPFCIFGTVVIMLGLDYFWPKFDKKASISSSAEMKFETGFFGLICLLLRDCRKFYKNVKFSKLLVCLFYKFQAPGSRQNVFYRNFI